MRVVRVCVRVCVRVHVRAGMRQVGWASTIFFLNTLVYMVLRPPPLCTTTATTFFCHLCITILRFGGGTVIEDNLMFNTCGESGDHGAINTWDRQAFLTTVATGKPSYFPAVNTIHHNFIVSNGDADGGAIDNDDGSSYYLEHSNFCIYGGAKMANIDGHAKVYHSNINAYANVYGKTCNWQWPGWFPDRPVTTPSNLFFPFVVKSRRQLECTDPLRKGGRRIS